MTNQRIDDAPSTPGQGDDAPRASEPVGQGESVRPRRVFAPNVWLSLLALAVVLTTALLAHWQWSRYDEKLALQAQFEAQQKEAPFTSLKSAQLPRDRYARVRVRGQFDPRIVFLHDNQIQQGRAGLHAYALFRPLDGSAPFLVNRGWLPLPATRALIAVPETGSDAFTLVGRINIPAQHTRRLAENADSATLKQTIDIEALRAQWGLPSIANFLIEQTEDNTTESAKDSLVRAWPAPDLKIQTHQMYAGQWALFSLLAAALWLIFSFKKRPA